MEKKKLDYTKHRPSKAKQEAIAEAVRNAIRARFGKPVAVETKLSHRYTDNASGAPYIRLLLENFHTVFITHFHKGELTVKISDKPASKSSYTVALYLKKLVRQERAERAKEASEKK